MIPFVASVHVQKRQRESQFWIPLILIWLLLLPLALLLLPIFVVACCIGRVDPFHAVTTLWGVLTSLNGTDIELGWQDRSVLVRLF